METYSTQVMELLSLGKLPNRCFQIKVGITHLDKQTIYDIEIDEFTYQHIEALQPLGGARVRLSPYPKWDPYRNTHYCTLVRTLDVSRETLHFACSEEFIAELEQIRQMNPPLVRDEEGNMRAAAVEEFNSASKPRSTRQRVSSRVVGMVSRLLVVSGLLVYLCLWFGSGWLTDDSNAMSGQLGTVQAAEVETAGSTPVEEEDAKESPSQATVTQVSLPPPTVQDSYEVIEIEENHSTFGLPKEYVALTFDDGPSMYTKKIVDILTKHNVAATFLFVGKNVVRNPDAVTYASERGMSIGNHSWDHSVMTKAKPAEQANNLAKTSKAIESLTNIPVTLFRPPYGNIDEELTVTAGEQQLKILLWNRDPEDWDADKPEDILDYFRKVKASGGVYVLHEDKQTVEALPEIIEYLQKKNMTFATFK